MRREIDSLIRVHPYRDPTTAQSITAPFGLPGIAVTVDPRLRGAFCFYRVLSVPRRQSSRKRSPSPSDTSRPQWKWGLRQARTDIYESISRDPLSPEETVSSLLVPSGRRGCTEKGGIASARAGFPATDRPVAVASRSDVFIGKGRSWSSKLRARSAH